MKKLCVIVISIFILVANSHAQPPKSWSWEEWREYIRSKDEQLEQVVGDVDIIYQLIAEIYVKEFSEEKYNEIIWDEEGME